VTERSVVTIERHIMEQERQFPEATGALSNLLYDVALAAKLISREVRRAGLVDILGQTGSRNVHGERVKKLDEYANDVIYRALDHCGHLCVMASEEADDPIPIPDRFPTGAYSFLYDPLDGSSNIDANVSVGTIFSIHRKISDVERGSMEDLLQPGSRQVAAGYVLYGSSTMLVYTTGSGVHGFTLDPSIGEFVLSHPDMKIPVADQRIYSINEGNYRYWSDGQRRLVDHLKGLDDDSGRPFTSRYVGSMVADIHRTLLYGGLFMYPSDLRNPKGKLRLLYEAAPMAMLVEQAGGRATDGVQAISSIQPRSLHECTPLFVGSTECMQVVERFLRSDRTGSEPDPVAVGA
jgi:fructose-1,6-bisphosphatase I